MAEVAPLTTRLVILAISLFWGLVCVGGMVVSMVKYGPLKFFRKQKRDTRPACLDDPALGTHQFMRLKNVRMHYVASGPEGKPLMLFVHGFPEFWYSWRHQLREFNKDYRCVAIDMRGYGETEKPKELSDYTVPKIAEDLKELVAALGYEKCTVVAHDWGGFIAQYFTFNYPDMVQRLVLCNIPHPTVFHRYVWTDIKQFLKSWYIFFFQLPVLPELQTSSFDYAFVNRLFKRAGEASDTEAYKWSMAIPGGLRNPINYYRALFYYKQKEYPKEPSACPTLMVWGTQDEALSKEMAALSAAHYTDFTLRYIETSGHWVQMEAPKETNDYMREFLQRKKSE